MEKISFLSCRFTKFHTFLIRNSPNLDDFHLVLLFRLKRESPVSSMPEHLQLSGTAHNGNCHCYLSCYLRCALHLIRISCLCQAAAFFLPGGHCTVTRGFKYDSFLVDFPCLDWNFQHDQFFSTQGKKLSTIFVWKKHNIILWEWICASCGCFFQIFPYLKPPLQVRVWLGIFQVFGVRSFLGKMKMFWTNLQELCRRPFAGWVRRASTPLMWLHV